jgi:hypothetical protein
VTRRATVIAALAAVIIAAVAAIVGPLLPGHARPPHPLPNKAVAAPPPQLTSLADRAANQALACPAQASPAQPSASRTGPTRWCGPLTVTRQQISCGVGLCTVEIVGTFPALAGTTVAVALTVTMRTDRGGWRSAEVSS